MFGHMMKRPAGENKKALRETRELTRLEAMRAKKRYTGYFAVLLIFEKRFLLQNARWVKVPEWIRRGLTFFMVMLGWGLFSGFGSELWTALAGGYGGASARTLLTCAAYAPMLLLCAGISFLPEPKRVALRRFAAPVLMILCLAALAAQGYAPFVYFQF